MNKLLLTLALILGFGLSAFADPKSRKELRGDKQFFVYRFEKAIDSYSHAKNLSIEGQRRLATSYSNLGQNQQAEITYARLAGNTDGSNSNDYYNYAMILKQNGKQDQSDLWMNKFASSHPQDLRVKDYMANRNRFGALSRDDGRYAIDYLDINTNDDDYGTSYFNNQIVFSSSRAKPKMIVKKYNWTGKAFGDMYVSDIAGTQLKAPKNFSRKLNGKMHDGPSSFSNNGSYMAFTRNNYDTKKKDRVINLEICFSTLTDDKWSDPEPFYLNNAEYSVGHPSLSPDGRTMFFSSNQPGGYGGADIYRVTKNSQGKWGTADNMGSEINTEGDELFPFFEYSNDILFYSSNGRYGLGGLDVFVCPLDGEYPGTSVNAGAPLNSAYDDFGLIVDSTLDKGYFSSNRAGGKSGDDIYFIDILKSFDIGKKINGIAKDEKGRLLPGTFISLLDDQKTVIDTATTDSNGGFAFNAATDQNFQLTATKYGYSNGSSLVSTFGKNYITSCDVILAAEEKEITIVKNAPIGTNLAELIVMNPIYFDLNESVIRADAEIELLKIVKTMNANPTIAIEISSYTDCRESESYNQELSNRRAASTVAFIKARITNPGRVTGKGLGESNLVNRCSCSGDERSTCSEEQHQKNRRTEFRIVQR